MLLLSVAGPVDFNNVPTVNAKRAQTSYASRIVPDGTPFPADYRRGDSDRKSQPVQE